MRNVLAVVPKGNAEMVTAAIRTIFAQPDAEHVEEQFDVIAGMLGRQLPKVEAMLREAKDDLLAFAGFPQVHWRQIWSTWEDTQTVDQLGMRTATSGRLQQQYRINPDLVRALPDGEAVVAHAGRWAHVRVSTT